MASDARRNRRQNDPAIQQKREALAVGSNVVSPVPLIGGPVTGMQDPGGWGVGSPDARPAGGQRPVTNPFISPKGAGLTIMSQTYPSNYFVEWNLTTWRYAIDQVVKQGQTMSYATLAVWCYQCSAFVQGLFAKLGSALDEVKFMVVDRQGNPIESMQAEFVDNPWQMEMRREILFSFMWGFTGLNFDPIEGRVYKYPMQQIDPINRFLRASTYDFYDGDSFENADNLLFVQPSTNQESFLGWMPMITRAFILMNQSKNNWVAAGRRLAFPIMTVGYPQNDAAINLDGQDINPFKVEAEEIAASIDPSKGFVFPYTIGPNGDIVKSIEIDFQDPKSGQNMYKIYSEFNDDEKNDIRECVLGGTLSSAGSKSGSGSRSLGEVHERMFKQAVKGKLQFILNVMNGPYKPKLEKFYTNLPEGWMYAIDKTETMTMEELSAYSSVVTANGLRLTPQFFQDRLNIPKEYLVAAPAPEKPEKAVNDPDPQVNAAGLKKKSYW